MTHDFWVKEIIEHLTEEIAAALNKDITDHALIKAYNKLTVYHECFAFEIVVRLPMEENELRNHRDSLKRKRELRNWNKP